MSRNHLENGLRVCLHLFHFVFIQMSYIFNLVYLFSFLPLLLPFRWCPWRLRRRPGTRECRETTEGLRRSSSSCQTTDCRSRICPTLSSCCSTSSSLNPSWVWKLYCHFLQFSRGSACIRVLSKKKRFCFCSDVNDHHSLLSCPRHFEDR